jgi:hypothetical protein
MISRRSFLGGWLAEGAPRARQEALSLKRTFGLRCDGRDETSALQSALDVSFQTGRPLFAEPRATLGFSGPLLLRGTFDGRGAKLVALNPQTATLIMTGVGPALYDTSVVSPYAKQRLVGAQCVRVENASAFALRGVSVWGAGSSGITIKASSRGRVMNCSATRTHADGLHITDGSTQIMVFGFHAERTGDDGVAVVSYAKDEAICEDITMLSCRSRLANARGFSVVGGRRVTLIGCHAERSRCAGFYFFREEAYQTLGVERCFTIDCATSDAVQDPTISQGAFHMGGTEGATPVGGILVPNKAVGCGALRPQVQGGGAGQQAAVSLRRGSERCWLTGGRFQDLPSTGIFNNGKDNAFVNNHGRAVVGPWVRSGEHVEGRCLDIGNDATGVALGQKVTAARLIAPAKKLTSYLLSGSQVSSPEHVAPLRFMNHPTRLQVEGVTHNGSKWSNDRTKTP